jgi:hypothetical protein
MSLPAYITTDLSKYTFSGMTGLNISNFNNYIVSSRFIGTSFDSSQNLVIDIGSVTKTTNCFIAHNHNFGPLLYTGSIKLEAADDVNFTLNKLTVINDIALYDIIIFKEFAPITKRYFRIAINGQLLQTPYIGNIFIDEVKTFNFPMMTGFKDNNRIYETSTFTTVSGLTRNSQMNSLGKAQYEFSFALLNEATKNWFLEFVKDVRGRAMPFYYVNPNGECAYVNLSSDYTPMTVIALNLNSLENLILIGNNNNRMDINYSEINCDVFGDSLII